MNSTITDIEKQYNELVKSYLKDLAFYNIAAKSVKDIFVKKHLQESQAAMMILFKDLMKLRENIRKKI